MNQEKDRFTELLKLAGMNRTDFAEVTEISSKTTYWKTPPKWAIAFLNLMIDRNRYKEICDHLWEVERLMGEIE